MKYRKGAALVSGDVDGCRAGPVSLRRSRDLFAQSVREEITRSTSAGKRCRARRCSVSDTGGATVSRGMSWEIVVTRGRSAN